MCAVIIDELDATRADAAVALWRACGLTRPWNDPGTDFTRAIDGPASAVLGAVDGDTLVGTAMVGVDGHRGWVYYLAVDPARRGAGLGRELMAACERWVLAHGAPKLELMIRRDNEPVVAFYGTLGYAREPVVVMARRLVPND